MMQILFLLFLGLVYVLVRHLWRNRRIYTNLYRLFSAKPTGDPQGPNAQEKRIITCPYCGSAPEVTSEPCSKCGRIL